MRRNQHRRLEGVSGEGGQTARQVWALSQGEKCFQKERVERGSCGQCC